MKIISALIICLTSLMLPYAAAAEEIFEIDSGHTFPSFEVSHMNLSTLRGKFTKTTGKIVMDRDHFKGTVEIRIDPSSLDTGNEALNIQLQGKDFMDVKRYPDIIYVGSMTFSLRSPTNIKGQFTLHGITKPLTLKIERFNCDFNAAKNYICGADASGSFNWADYGIAFGEEEGISTQVKLLIQAEALRVFSDDDTSPATE